MACATWNDTRRINMLDKHLPRGAAPTNYRAHAHLHARSPMISSRRIARSLALFTLTVATTVADGQGAATSAADAGPPPVARELRAAWVATVENIDWPSRPGLSTAQQQLDQHGGTSRLIRRVINAASGNEQRKRRRLHIRHRLDEECQPVGE